MYIITVRYLNECNKRPNLLVAHVKRYQYYSEAKCIVGDVYRLQNGSLVIITRCEKIKSKYISNKNIRKLKHCEYEYEFYVTDLEVSILPRYNKRGILIKSFLNIQSYAKHHSLNMLKTPSYLLTVREIIDGKLSNKKTEFLSHTPFCYGDKVTSLPDYNNNNSAEAVIYNCIKLCNIRGHKHTPVIFFYMYKKGKYNIFYVQGKYISLVPYKDGKECIVTHSALSLEGYAKIMKYDIVDNTNDNANSDTTCAPEEKPDNKGKNKNAEKYGYAYSYSTDKGVACISEKLADKLTKFEYNGTIYTIIGEASNGSKQLVSSEMTILRHKIKNTQYTDNLDNYGYRYCTDKGFVYLDKYMHIEDYFILAHNDNLYKLYDNNYNPKFVKVPHNSNMIKIEETNIGTPSYAIYADKELACISDKINTNLFKRVSINGEIFTFFEHNFNNTQQYTSSKIHFINDVTLIKDNVMPIEEKVQTPSELSGLLDKDLSKFNVRAFLGDKDLTKCTNGSLLDIMHTLKSECTELKAMAKEFKSPKIRKIHKDHKKVYVKIAAYFESRK